VLVGRAADGPSPTLFLATQRPHALHEYGPSLRRVGRRGHYSNFADQRIYRVDVAHTPSPITPGGNVLRDATIDEPRARLISVCEGPRKGGHERSRRLSRIPLDRIRIRDSGFGRRGDRIGVRLLFDAVSALTDSQLSWLAWRSSADAVDGSELWVADVTRRRRARGPVRVAGSTHEFDSTSPMGAGRLALLRSDRTGWESISSAPRQHRAGAARAHR